MGEKKNLRLKLSAKKMLAWGFCLLVLLQMGAGEESCAHSAKLDLQIIVDSSASVGKAHFVTMMKKISKSLIGQFDIGKDKTRVVLFKYSMNRVMKSEVSLGQYLRKKNLQKKIESTSYAPGWTMTAMAMENALKIFKEKQRSDKHTAKVCLVFTDCVATDRSKVPAASKAWAADGVTVFAIGIGKGMEGTAGHQGLKDIAGDDERAFSVENFEAIGEMAKSLLKKVCTKVEKVNPLKPKPKPKPAPKPKPDGKATPPPPPPKPPGPKIPDGYKKGGDGYYYKYHTDQKNWNDAQRTCKSEGGNLAIIWNQKTRDVVNGFMKNGWIGVTDQWSEGRWQTPVKGNIPYSSWNRGEPNNAGNEDCTIQHGSKKCNDLNCNSQQPYICQFKAGVGERENEEFSEEVAEMEREEEDLDEEVVEMEKEEADLDETLVQMEKGVDEEIVEKVREEEDFDEAVEEVEKEEADLSDEILGVKKEAADLSEEVVELKKEA